MAKNNTKKGGSKKAPAKKSVAKATPKKEETPVMEEPQVDNDTVEELTGNGNPEGTNEGSGDFTEATDNQVENADEQGPDQEPEATMPEPEPVANIKTIVPKPTWRDRVMEEAKELNGRMIKLRTAIDTRTVPTDQIGILEEQYAAMYKLYLILNTRLSRK